MAKRNAHHKMVTRKFILVVRSELIHISKIERFLMKVNRLLHLDEVQFNKLFIATTEAVNNSILHGNKSDPKKRVTVICEIGARTLTIRVRDEGRGFHQGRLRNPLLKENLLRENGRGIFLMRTLMDNVGYSVTPEGAEVVMKLRLRLRNGG